MTSQTYNRLRAKRARGSTLRANARNLGSWLKLAAIVAILCYAIHAIALQKGYPNALEAIRNLAIGYR